MYKKTSYEQLVRKIYSYLSDCYFTPIVGAKVPMHDVIVSMANYGSSFCTYKDGKYHVVLDRKFLFERVKDAKEIIVEKEFDQVFYDTYMYLMAFFYHEIGHVKFTSFSFKEILIGLSEEEKYYCCKLFNVLEDPLIEAEMKRVAYASRKYFAYITTKIFESMPDGYVDNDDFPSLFSYLLLALRLGRASLKITNKFFDDNASEIEEYVSRFYSERDGEKRPAIVLEFFKFLRDKGLEMPKPKDVTSEHVPSSAGKSSAPSASASTSVSSAIASSLSSGSSGSSDDADSSSGSGGSSSSKEDEDGDDTASSGDGSENEEEGGGDSFPTEACDYEHPTTDGFRNYDAYASSSCTHEFTSVRKVTSPPASVLKDSEDYFLNTVVKFDSVVNDCMEKIDSFESVNQDYFLNGYSSGRFNMNSFVKGESILKCFDKKIGFDVNPDLSFYIMVDGSGSMCGNKSSLCTQAMMVLYECLTRLDIPFELSTFTNTGDCAGTHCLTHVIKSFDDDPSLMKGYLSFTDSTKYSAYKLSAPYTMFYGNYDEVNLSFCGERLKERINRDKIMIVLSDGETCGSCRELKSVAEQLEASGVLVLGVGICCSAVKDIYSKNIVFSSSSDLEKFPEFLGNFLVDLYTNK